MEEVEEDLVFGSQSSAARIHTATVSLIPFAPIPPSSSRRLSSNFNKPSLPVVAARRLARVSLHGRIVNAEEASSARTIGGGFSLEEAVAWELFTPIQRFLLVAVISVAVSESKKNRIIYKLNKSVELRDQVLTSMQQKLDDLCEQLNNVKDQSRTVENMSFNKNPQSPCTEGFDCEEMKFVNCGCWLCNHHFELVTGNGITYNSSIKVSSGDEVLQYKMPLINEGEQEERRMSDFSDWASSITSAADIQMSSFGMDQDISNIRKDCEEKDANIIELTSLLQSSKFAGSKRIAELEDIIRRKNMMITRLKKDMIVLEEKVMHLTRLRRPSCTSTTSSTKPFPVMLDNIIYDMDNTTSPSSSDSDSPSLNRPKPRAAESNELHAQISDFVLTTNHKSEPAKCSSPKTPVSEADVISTQESGPVKDSSLFVRFTDQAEACSVSPLREICTYKSNTLTVSKQKQKSLVDRDMKQSKRPTPIKSKDSMVGHKRWL